MYNPKPDSYADRLPVELLPLRETLAKRIHDAWAAGRFSEGWKYGPTLNDNLRTHPCLIPYEQLPEQEKEYDRRTAAVTISCVLENGYRIVPAEEVCPSDAVSAWIPETKQPHIMSKGTTEKKLDYGLLLTSAYALEWKNADNPSAAPRLPKEKTVIYPKGLPFFAAGRLYMNTKDLIAVKKPGKPSPWVLDKHGRKVFHVWESVPKFDSFDHSDRRGHSWYFLCENGILTRIYCFNNGKVHVTEDVAYVESGCWRRMEQYGYFDCR